MNTYISWELLEDLQAIFPNKLPITDIGTFAFGREVGKQCVISYLANRYAIQSKTTPTRKP